MIRADTVGSLERSVLYGTERFFVAGGQGQLERACVGLQPQLAEERIKPAETAAGELVLRQLTVCCETPAR
jgi:hypothetical protein